MRPSDDSRMRTIRDRAYRLADTGRFDGWRSIEAAMVAEGWPDSHEALSSDYARLAIKDRCVAARPAFRH